MDYKQMDYNNFFIVTKFYSRCNGIWIGKAYFKNHEKESFIKINDFPSNKELMEGDIYHTSYFPKQDDGYKIKIDNEYYKKYSLNYEPINNDFISLKDNVIIINNNPEQKDKYIDWIIQKFSQDFAYSKIRNIFIANVDWFTKIDGFKILNKYLGKNSKSDENLNELVRKIFNINPTNTKFKQNNSEYSDMSHNLIIGFNPYQSSYQVMNTLQQELPLINKNCMSIDGKNKISLLHEIGHTQFYLYTDLNNNELTQKNYLAKQESFSDSFALLTYLLDKDSDPKQKFIDAKIFMESRYIGSLSGIHNNIYLTGDVCFQTIRMAKNIIKQNKTLSIAEIANLSKQINDKYRLYNPYGSLHNFNFVAFAKNKKQTIKEIDKIVTMINDKDIKDYYSRIKRHLNSFLFFSELKSSEIKSLLEPDFYNLVEDFKEKEIKGEPNNILLSYKDFYQTIAQRVNQSSFLKRLLHKKIDNKIPESVKASIKECGTCANAEFIAVMDYPYYTDHDLPYEDKKLLIERYMTTYKDVSLSWGDRDTALKEAKLLAEFEIFQENPDNVFLDNITNTKINDIKIDWKQGLVFPESQLKDRSKPVMKNSMELS